MERERERERDSPSPRQERERDRERQRERERETERERERESKGERGGANRDASESRRLESDWASEATLSRLTGGTSVSSRLTITASSSGGGLRATALFVSV